MLNIRNYKTNCIYDYIVDNEYAIEIKELKKGERASLVSDTMFKTMFQNQNRIKYSVKLLSCILDISYEELLKKLRLYKNETNKKYKIDKNQRCDYVAEIDESYVNIEVNNNSSLETMERNIDYLNNIYRKEIEEGKEYKYNQTIQINLNNFSFKGKDNIMDIYSIQNEEGIMLTRNIIFVQIYIPNIRKKWYTKGKKSLNELERCILALIEPDIEKAKDISVGDNIMEEYVDESVKVCEEKFFGESYDKEWALKDEWKRVGLQQGLQQGIQQGSLQTKLDIAKNMLSLNMKIEDISKATGLEVEEIEKLKY